MIKGTSKYNELAETLEGIYTLETLSQKLKISKIKAIYVIHCLRKLGCVKTGYGSGKIRVYRISLKNKQKGISYTEIINKAAPSAGLRLGESKPYYIHGRIPGFEETLIYALKQRDIRHIIALLALYRKVRDWSLLYRLAKKENMLRETGALYDVARKAVRKVRRMPKRFRNLALPKKGEKFKFVVHGISSDDFKELEKKWKVYIPLNRADLEEYKWR